MAKKAYKKLVRRSDGTNGVVHIDADTGAEIPSHLLDTYAIISAGGFDDSEFLKNKKDKEVKEEDELLRQIIEGESPGTGVERSENNNWGWIEPNLLTKALGMFGVPGRVLSTAINANNAMAKNKAREAMGLPPVSLGQSLKGAVFGVDPVVAKVEIDGKQYSVSVGAKGATSGGKVINGVTTLTPAEAARRGALGGGLKEVGAPKGVQQTQTQAPKTQTQAQPQAQITAPQTQPQVQAPIAGLPQVGLNMGPNRPGAPNSDVVEAAQRAVNNVFGSNYSISVTSGRPPEGTQYGSNRHNVGKAMDFSVVDPAGNKVTDSKSLAALASELGKQGITSLGHGKGYMGTGVFHVDTLKDEDYGPRQGTTWGATSKEDRGILSAFNAQRTNVGILPSVTDTLPSSRPSTSLAQIQGITSPALTARQAQEESMQNLGTQQQTTAVGFSNANYSAVPSTGPRSPAEAAALGFITRTDQEINQIAMTLAGELSPSQLAGIARGDQKAMTELANMVTTIENRAGSGKYGSFGEVFSPSQYNSLMAKNLGTTKENLSLYENSIKSLVESYYNPEGIKPSSYSLTHYYNPNISNPNWGSKMKDAVTIGDHRFGVLDSRYDTPNPYSDYSIGRSIAHERESLSISGNSGYDRSGALSTARGADGRGTGLDTGRSPESSFGGFSAGSLGGSATAWSGLGGLGSDAAIGGGFTPGGLGNYSGGTSSSNAGGFNSGTYGGSTPGGSGVSPSGPGGALSGI